MKWLLIVLLVCSVLVSGCSSNKTGFECVNCEGEVAKLAPLCPHCGQPFRAWFTDEIKNSGVPDPRSVE
jgi:hypothetical protein